MTCGIYKLSFAGTNQVYIGQSEYIEQRFISHIKSFKTGKASKKLLDAYNKYGEPSLTILIEATKDELNDLENNAIEVYDSYNNGFNSQQFAEDVPILFGQEHPQSKYSNEQIEAAFNLLLLNQYTHQKIADMSGISKNMVNSIAIGSCHRWLEYKYPDKYKELISNKKAFGDSKQRGKYYPTVVSPLGVEYNIENLRSFSRIHNLPYSSLNSLVNYRTDNVKGWKRLNSNTV